MNDNTLHEIKDLYDEYVQSLSNLDGEEQACKVQATEMKKQLLECFDIYKKMDPVIFQINYPDYMGSDDVAEFKSSLRKAAANRFTMDILPTGFCVCDRINDDVFCTPTYRLWQVPSNEKQNVWVNYSEGEREWAKGVMEKLLLNIILSFPINKVNVSFFDFGMTNMAEYFTANMPNQLYHDTIVVDSQTAHKRIEGLLEHMATVMKQYGNLTDYNNRHGEIAVPYEIVVLMDYPNQYDNYVDELTPLFKNGHNAGVYFIVLNNYDISFRNEETEGLIEYKKNYEFISSALDGADIYDGMVSFTPFAWHPYLSRICMDYIVEESNREPERVILKQDFNNMLCQDYENDITSEISVTVGLDTKNKEQVTLRFNSGDYIHAFILGQSGSGKSVLLNNIITSAICKYSPEDLMLYLMDFKGVEFNRYRGVKHTKAVLVDNSDPQMTLEVLRELKEENRKRVKLWQQEGVNNIDGYNRKHPDSKLPQVLFVADECQVMFSRVDAGRSSFVIQREIAEIINIIATQGRSQGIHMLLATQQLDETDISGQVLKNLTECFLLMSAPGDSEKLVPDSSDLTAKQPTGQCCYYHKKELQAQVQTYYATDEELEKAISISQQKADGHTSNGEAYFKGSSMFWFNEAEACLLREGVTRFPIASIGRNIGINGRQTLVPLTRDFSENILFFGANREEQTVGVTLNAMLSLMESHNKLNMWAEFVVIDCTNNYEGKYKRVLERLQNDGRCRVIGHAEAGNVLKRLSDDIFNKTATPTILTIIGNERFAEIKRQTSLEESLPSSFDVMGDISLDMSCMTDLSGNGIEPMGGANVKTYPQALQYILDEGPTQGIHVLLQVDKPANILFEGEYGKNATDKFRHKIILRSENKYLTVLNFSVDIDVETLSDEEEHLRAYYYPEDGEPQLFTPYLIPEID